MKKVFSIDQFGKLISKEVADDYVLQDNELPEQPKLQATQSEAQQLSKLALQQAQFQANQQKLNSQLALQLATLAVKGA